MTGTSLIDTGTGRGVMIATAVVIATTTGIAMMTGIAGIAMTTEGAGTTIVEVSGSAV